MIATVLLVLASSFWLAGFAFWLSGRHDLKWGCWAVCNGLLAAESAVLHDWAFAVIWAVFAVSAARFWHDERRKRRRKGAAALLGEKSKALLDALARKAREAARPSPVLRPSLRGASCAMAREEGI